jgi:flavin-dependent dehydrogenase
MMISPKSTDSWDDIEKIKILGAGLSGLSTAINLVKKGYNIEVYEKRRRIGGRFNGDLQGIENWSNPIDIIERLSKMNIITNFNIDPFLELTLTNLSREVHFTLDRPAFYLVKRGHSPGTLDHGLAEQALDLGVQIHLGKTLNQQEANIIATGPSLGKAFGIVKGITFQTSMNDIVIAILGDAVAHRGYAYLLITRGHGCLCSTVMGRHDKIQECFQKAKKAFSEKIKLDIQNPKRFVGIGGFSATTTFQKDGKLFVGEAAGIQDLLWGFGIDKAITSGYLAAQSIINKQEYEKLATNILGDSIKAAIVNRFLWEIIHIDDYSLFIDLIRNVRDPLNLLHKISNYDLLHQALLPLAKGFIKKQYPQIS